MDSERRTVMVAERSVTLTPREFDLLSALVEAQGRIVTHGALLQRVWGKAHRDDIDYLRVAIRSLRLKIEDDASRPHRIRNEPGVGYCLG